jgi:hypothetical protein
VRFARRVVVIDFDIVDLGAADDLFLEMRRRFAPCVEVVQILLDDDIAASGEVDVFIADQCRCRQIEAGRVGRAVDKAEQVTGIEIPKARNFVDNSYGSAEIVEQDPFKFKTHVGTFGPDMEQKVALC